MARSKKKRDSKQRTAPNRAPQRARSADGVNNTRRSPSRIKRMRDNVSPQLVNIVHLQDKPLSTRDRRINETPPDETKLAAPKRERPKTKPQEGKNNIRRDRRCKPQPENNRGNGGSRPFVLWCK